MVDVKVEELKAEVQEEAKGEEEEEAGAWLAPRSRICSVPLGADACW